MGRDEKTYGDLQLRFFILCGVANCSLQNNYTFEEIRKIFESLLLEESPYCFEAIDTPNNVVDNQFFQSFVSSTLSLGLVVEKRGKEIVSFDLYEKDSKTGKISRFEFAQQDGSSLIAADSEVSIGFADSVAYKRFAPYFDMPNEPPENDPFAGGSLTPG